MHDEITYLSVTAEPLKENKCMAPRLQLEVVVVHKDQAGNSLTERLLSVIDPDDFMSNLEKYFREMYQAMRARVMQQRNRSKIINIADRRPQLRLVKKEE